MNRWLTGFVVASGTTALMGVCAHASPTPSQKPGHGDLVRVGSVSVARGIQGGEPLLTDTSQKRWLLVGKLREELLRLEKHEIRVQGREGKRKQMMPTIRVKRYRLLRLDGGQPEVGRLVKDPNGQLSLQQRERTLVVVAAEKTVLKQLQLRVGCRVWLLGELKGQSRIHVRKFGWIRCTSSPTLKVQEST
jgi:hypothetical protein